MKAKAFDEQFDAGEDMSAALDTARARRPGEEHRRVNVDFPAWMIAELDRETTRLRLLANHSSRCGSQRNSITAITPQPDRNPIPR